MGCDERRTCAESGHVECSHCCSENRAHTFSSLLVALVKGLFILGEARKLEKAYIPRGFRKLEIMSSVVPAPGVERTLPYEKNDVVGMEGT